MVKITRSKYEPKTKLAIHFGGTIRHISYPEAKKIVIGIMRYVLKEKKCR